jgi:hypothetical protein
MEFTTAAPFSKKRGFDCLPSFVASPVLDLFYNQESAPMRVFSGFLIEFSCQQENRVYDVGVLLGDNFGDWATPKKPTAGHFFAPSDSFLPTVHKRTDNSSWVFSDFLTKLSCQQRNSVYYVDVLLGDDFGDWATPKKPTAGHFFAPLWTVRSRLVFKLAWKPGCLFSPDHASEAGSHGRCDAPQAETAVSGGCVADLHFRPLDARPAAVVTFHGGGQNAAGREGPFHRVGRPARDQELLDVGHQAVEILRPEGAGR